MSEGRGGGGVFGGSLPLALALLAREMSAGGAYFQRRPFK